MKEQKIVRFTTPIGPDDIVAVERCLNPNAHPNEMIWVSLDEFQKLKSLTVPVFYEWLKKRP